MWFGNEQQRGSKPDEGGIWLQKRPSSTTRGRGSGSAALLAAALAALCFWAGVGRGVIGATNDRVDNLVRLGGRLRDRRPILWRPGFRLACYISVQRYLARRSVRFECVYFISQARYLAAHHVDASFQQLRLSDFNGAEKLQQLRKGPRRPYCLISCLVLRHVLLLLN